MVTILIDNEIMEADGESGSGGQLWISTSNLERITGLSSQSEELRKEDVVVPLPSGQSESHFRGNDVNVAALWRQMDKPALSDESGNVWVLGAGPEERAAALQSLQAPDFTLPDLDGRPHSLSDSRGKKVFLASWASW